MVVATFPGQGSQRPGMGLELHDRFAAARNVFESVEVATDRPIRRICFEVSEEELRETQNAQLALFTCGMAAYRALEAEVPDLAPIAFAGHSVGEYAAVCASGALSLEQSARLVDRRGQIMAASGRERPGTMAAILGMTVADLDQVCVDSSRPGSVVVVANDNCPGQLVISGDTDAVQRACVMATERGAKRALPLNVSGAFHSPLMDLPAEEMTKALAEATFGPMSAPIISNSRASRAEDSESVAAGLKEQLRSAVRWTESVGVMLGMGGTTFLEFGSGEVLTGLLRRIDKSAAGLPVVDGATLESAVAALQGVPA